MPQRKAGKFVRNTFQVTEAQIEYLDTKSKWLGISVSELMRRILDKDRFADARERGLCEMCGEKKAKK